MNGDDTHSEISYRLLFNFVSDAIFIHDLEGRFLEVNQSACETLHYTRDELLAKTLVDIDLPMYADLVQLRISQLEREGRAFFETAHVRKDGSVIPVELNSRIIDFHGKPAVLSIGRDISERKAAETAKQRQQDQLEDMVLQKTSELLKEIAVREQIEAQLRESELRFRKLFENAPLGYQSLDGEGRFIEVNQAWLDLMGYIRPEVIGRWFGDFLAPESVDLFRNTFPQFKIAGTINDVEFFLVRKDGAIRLISFNGRISLDQQGNFKQTHCILADITEQRQAEIALRHSEETRRVLLNASQDSALLIDLDGNIILLNQASARRMGRTVNDLIGANIYHLFPEELVESRKLQVDKMLAYRTPIHFVDVRDGKTYSNLISPVTDQQGEISHIAIYGRDITKQLRDELALRTSETMFRALAEQALVGIAILFDQRIIFANETAVRITGYSQGEIQSWGIENIETIVHPDDVSSIDFIYETMTDWENNDLVLSDLRLTQRDGNIRWVIVNLRWIDWGEGPAIVISAIDITDRKLAELALLEAEIKFKTVADFTYDWEMWIDPNGKIIYISPACERVSGYPPEAFIQNPHLLHQIILPTDREIYHQHYCAKEKSIGDLDTVFRIRRADGAVRWVEHACQPVTSEAGDFLGFRSSNRDVTFRKQAKQALEESEERFRLLFENSPVGVGLARDGVFFQANPAYLKMFGYEDIAELDNLSALNQIAPEHREAVVQWVAKSKRGEPGTVPMEILGLKKDGTTIPLRVDTSILELPGGQAVVGFFTDISYQKEHEAILVESEERLQQIIKQMPFPVEICSPSGTAYMVNNAFLEMFGMVSDEAMAARYNSLQVPVILHQLNLKQEIKQVFQGNVVIIPELAIPLEQFPVEYGVTKKGTILQEVTLFPVFRSNGKVWRVVTIFNDITARKAAEEGLRHSLVEKEDLLKEIHHRVKNNLQVVVSLLQLQSDNLRDPLVRALFQETQNRVRSMAFVHALLYRSEDLAQVDFEEYVTQLVSHLYHSYGVDKEDIVFQLAVFDVKLPIEKAIPCGLIINELVSNSLKHAFPSGQPGTIELVFRQDPEKFLMILKDNGNGLSAEVDFDNSATLGFQLIHALTAQLKGKITLDSRQGVVFTLTIPT